MILPYNAIEQLSVNDLSFESVKKKKRPKYPFQCRKTFNYGNQRAQNAIDPQGGS